MGTVRALDSGTLSLTKFVKLLQGADITALTHPQQKAAELEAMRKRLAEQPAKKTRHRRK